jgi:hypothetical protein
VSVILLDSGEVLGKGWAFGVAFLDEDGTRFATGGRNGPAVFSVEGGRIRNVSRWYTHLEPSLEAEVCGASPDGRRVVLVSPGSWLYGNYVWLADLQNRSLRHVATVRGLRGVAWLSSQRKGIRPGAS